MSKNISKNTFNPDYAIAPGFILEEILESRSISQTEFAKRCGRPIKTINGIIRGNVGIVEKTALEFEKVLGISATTWLNLENTYKIFQLKESEKRLFEKNVAWAKKFPISELVKRELIKKHTTWADKVNSLLEFFGFGSIESFENFWLNELNITQFKSSPSYKSSPEAVATWLRIGELDFQKNPNIYSYNEDSFRSAISKARHLITEKKDLKNTLKIVEEEFRKSGVVLLLTKPFPKVAICGSARWIASDKALIQLSLRHRTDDHLWFSLFHECAHILLHKKKSIYIDGSEKALSDEEKEADQYSRDILISTELWENFISSFKECENFSQQKNCIIDFAEEAKISKSTIVGRLQHEKYLGFSSTFNNFKTTLNWE